MKTMKITDFKAQALKVLATVAESREPVLITKRGKPLAEIVPCADAKPVAGKLADTVIEMGDIVTPLGADMWESTK